MSEQMLSPTRDDDQPTTVMADDLSSEGAALTAQSGENEKSAKKKKKKAKKPLEERHVYEAGGIIVCDGKVVLRLTDKQHWIFPKGKLKKHESRRGRSPARGDRGDRAAGRGARSGRPTC